MQPVHSRSERPLRVGIIAPPWVPVPPPVYGGTELVVDELARGLLDQGCEVRLFATGDSTCPVPTDWLYPAALGTAYHPSDELTHVAAAYRALAGVDVVHDHTLAGPTWAAERGVRTPIVTTIHGRITPITAVRYARMATQGTAVVAISEHQRSTAPLGAVRRVIHHGIDVGRYPMGAGDGGYVLFLGRMDADKGAHRAIQAAREAGVPILLAAKMREPAEHRYFREEVEPLLGPGVDYLGEVGGDEKIRLLAGATALVNPITWPEPFGLVMVEALACGTPVLAFPHGAAPEIVEDGVSGFLCAGVPELAAAIRDAPTLDRLRCRERVAQRFSTARMVQDHLALYRDVLRGRDRRRVGDRRTTHRLGSGRRAEDRRQDLEAAAT